MATFDKDSDATLDYKIDWADYLGADTITSSQWILPSADITEVVSVNTTTAATIWLSGGVINRRYTVTNRITTSGGRTDDRSITIHVVKK